MATRFVVLFFAPGCGPVVATDDASGTESSSDPPPSSSSTTTSGDTPTPFTTSGFDPSTGFFDTGIGNSTGSGESGIDTGPDLPPLPEACPGEVLAGDVLRAEEVYLGGTLSEGACYLDVLAHWSSPNDAVAGLDCYFDHQSGMIGPVDGRVLYTNVFENVLREFHCDECPIDDVDAYPSEPLDNDDVLATPGCGADRLATLRFLADPDGSYLYTCTEPLWHDADGVEVYDEASGRLLHLGYGDLVLTEAGVVALTTGVLAPMEVPIDDLLLAIRADPRDGFFVVRDEGGPTLYHVSSNGSTAELGEYPSAPDEYIMLHQAALDGCGALFQFGYGPGSFEDVIIRREIAGASDVVYSEIYNPLVKIHISDLITGP